MDSRSSAEDGSICIQVTETCDSRNAIFEPRRSLATTDSSNTNLTSQTAPAPEKKLTLFALRLAILEKAATGLGTLGFIWATVVLLGGFAITLDKTDFCFITIILLIEGTRIFSRSRELEWQHQATWSIADAGINSFRALRSVKGILQSLSPVKKRSQCTREVAAIGDGVPRRWDQRRTPTRTWITSDVPLLPYAPWVFLSRNVSKLLYWLQLSSAIACVVLSSMKLIKHNYGDIEKGDTDKRNRQSALNIFYSLALAEALLFLMEKTYWEWKVIVCKLLEEVNKECDLGSNGMISVKRFFYDAYSRCVNGSIFDGLKMDMVNFSMELLGSSSPDEQLIGARILCQFAKSEQYSEDTLKKIGINLLVIERLVEMLNWKDPEEEEIRRSAAEILSKLTSKTQNALRVTGISGALESISSLLEVSRSGSCAADEIREKKISHDHPEYGFWTFNQLGLLILKKLARDHDNCGKIGNTRGLLPKIIDLSHAESRWLKDKNVAATQILTVKRSLQVIKKLASTTCTTGKNLRREISEVVFTFCNIRDILQHGEKHPMLQKLGIEILTYLALQEDARERIGETGGVLKQLFNIFFERSMPENQNHVRISAGEALAMLVFQSTSNCYRVLKLGVLEKLVVALEVPLLRVNTARILRNLCSYGGEDSFHQLMHVKTAAPNVLKAIMSAEESKLQEVMVGVSAHVFKFMTSEESINMFEKAGIRQDELAKTLIDILRKYQKPSIRVPRIRRFAIELAIWMMQDNVGNVEIFKEIGMEKELENVMETTAELENFNIFSGTVGLSRHSTTVHSLVEAALKLLEAS